MTCQSRGSSTKATTSLQTGTRYTHTHTHIHDKQVPTQNTHTRPSLPSFVHLSLAWSLVRCLSVCRWYFTLILPKRYIPAWLNIANWSNRATVIAFYETPITAVLPPAHFVSLSFPFCLFLQPFLYSCCCYSPLCSPFFPPLWMLIKSLPWTHAWPERLPVTLQVIIPVGCSGRELPPGVGSVPQSICLVNEVSLPSSKCPRNNLNSHVSAADGLTEIISEDQLSEESFFLGLSCKCWQSNSCNQQHNSTGAKISEAAAREGWNQTVREVTWERGT